MTAVVLHRAPAVAAGLAELVGRCAPGLTTVLAAHPAECRRLIAEHPVVLAVLDATAGAAPVPGLCRELSSAGVPVVVLVDSAGGDYLDVVSAGASALVLVDHDGRRDLELALEGVLAGQVFLPPRLLGSLLRSLVERDRSERRSAEPLQRLSPREREVLTLLAAGLDDRDTAAALLISPHTAKTHVTRVLGKLGVSSRIEAVEIARRDGLIDDGPPDGRPDMPGRGER